MDHGILAGSGGGGTEIVFRERDAGVQHHSFLMNKVALNYLMPEIILSRHG